MASKKKLPHTRRCRNPEKLGLPRCIPQDEEDIGQTVVSLSTVSGNDHPDEAENFRNFRETETKFDQKASVSEADVTVALTSDKPIVFKGPPFNWFDVLIGLTSIGFFYFDVITDVLLAHDYYLATDFLSFGLTTAFVAGPSLVTAGLNFRWYWLDYVSQQIQLKHRDKKSVKLTSAGLWAARFIMTCLFMGPVMRQIEYIYNGVKSSSKSLSEKEKKHHYNTMRLEDVDACCIRMFECFLEAAPQLVLQIYILMSHKVEQEMITELLRAAAILSSWVSLSWSMVAYQKALRFSHEDKENLSIPGSICYFLWRACEIGPRVIALGVFAAYFHYGVFIAVGGHWVIMSAWLFCQKTKFYQNRCEEKIFNIVCGYVLVFSFLNVRDGRTRFRMVLFYAIMCLENWAMVGFWFYFTPDKSYWFYLPTIFIVGLAVILQVFFQLLYYGCCHPRGRGEIPCCPPRGDYTCYQSLCHDLEDEEVQYYIENGPVPAPV